MRLSLLENAKLWQSSGEFGNSDLATKSIKRASKVNKPAVKSSPSSNFHSEPINNWPSETAPSVRQFVHSDWLSFGDCAELFVRNDNHVRQIGMPDVMEKYIEIQK